MVVSKIVARITVSFNCTYDLAFRLSSRLSSIRPWWFEPREHTEFMNMRRRLKKKKKNEGMVRQLVFRSDKRPVKKSSLDRVVLVADKICTNL